MASLTARAPARTTAVYIASLLGTRRTYVNKQRKLAELEKANKTLAAADPGPNGTSIGRFARCGDGARRREGQRVDEEPGRRGGHSSGEGKDPVPRSASVQGSL